MPIIASSGWPMIGSRSRSEKKKNQLVMVKTIRNSSSNRRVGLM
jgi:hypothetical protein